MIKKFICCVLFMTILGCSENKKNSNEVEVFHVAHMDYIYDKHGAKDVYSNDNYYLGKIVIDIKNRNFHFIPVKTHDNLPEIIVKENNVLKGVLENIRNNGIVDERRLFTTNKKIRIDRDADIELLKYKLFNIVTPISDDVGEKYYDNNWSASRESELKNAIKYFNHHNYNQEISEDEYFKQFKKSIIIAQIKTILLALTIIGVMILLIYTLVKKRDK